MPIATRVPPVRPAVPPAGLEVLQPTTPVIVAWGPRNRAEIDRAVGLAATCRAPLHLVVGVAHPPSPWALLQGARPLGSLTHRRALELACERRVRGLHVEVHTTAGRPDRLAADIAQTIGGCLVA